MRILLRIGLGVGLWLLVALNSWADLVRTTIDRDQVQLGQPVTLTLHLHGLSQLTMPDLDPLQRDFAILGTTTSSTLTIINGQPDAVLTLSIGLQPLHTGQLRIPSIAVGNDHTPSFTVQVLGPGSRISQGGGRMIAPPMPSKSAPRLILEGGVEPKNPYVGQEVVFSLKLYYAINLTGGTLDEPPAGGFGVQPIKGDINSHSTRGGLPYNVVTRRFLLTPERAGELTVPGLTFRGRAIDPADPGGFFGSTVPVKVKSAPVHLKVRPIPADWGSSAWLPAKSLSLGLSGLPAGGKARVGQPIDLAMRLSAVGLPSSALPALNLPNLADAMVYPGPPKDSDKSQPTGTVGTRQRHFALVPQHAGKLTIPEITIKWWNLATGKSELARIPAQQMTVLPAAGSPAAAASAPALPASAAVAPPVSAASGKSRASNWPWRWIALTLLALWALSMLGVIGWQRHRRKTSAGAGKSERIEPQLGSVGRLAAERSANGGTAQELRQAFMQAAAGSDPTTQEHALLAWARSERAGIKSVSELAQGLTAAPQQAAIARLQRSRYARAKSSHDPDLATAFAAGFAWHEEQDDGQGDDGLPPLYPFKLD